MTLVCLETLGCRIRCARKRAELMLSHPFSVNEPVGSDELTPLSLETCVKRLAFGLLGALQGIGHEVLQDSSLRLCPEQV